MSEPISGKQAKEAAQRLINSHFGNADPARMSIPAQPTDDDLTIMAYIEQAEACKHACESCRATADLALTAYESHLQASGMAVVPGWQPIETRPAGMKATHLLCNAKGQVAPCVRGIIHVDDGESVWDWDYGEAATHWQPLPASPASPYGKAMVKEKDDE